MGSAADIHAWMAKVTCLGQIRPFPLVDSLQSIAEGMELRRQVERNLPTDLAGAASSPADLRKQVMEPLRGLQQLVADELTSIRPFMPEHEAPSTCLERIVEAESRVLDAILADVETSVLTRSLLLAGFRGDMEWWQGVARLLEGEPLPDPVAVLRVELHRLAPFAEDVAPDQAATSASLKRRVRQLEENLLERRVADALAAPDAEVTPERLWTRRFHLSHLRDELLSFREENRSDEFAGRLDATIDALDVMREKVAHLAVVRIFKAPPAVRQEAWDNIIHHALGEANEVVTRVEDAPLPRAVRMLETSRQDFRELDRSTRALLAKGVAEESDVTRLRRQSRRARVLSRRMRNELQERQLAWALENSLGRRFVTILENLVLLLILAMTVLIVTESVIEWSVGATPGQLRFFAWVDLAICCVFLAEFGLKLWFVERRWLYFRRHFLVDFLASLPFGFITYSLSVGEAAVESTPQLLRLLRFLRLPVIARYVRVAQPVIRFGRLILFAMRFTDHLVRRSGGVINRNIILFEPEKEDSSLRRYHLALVTLRERYSRQTIALHAELGRAERQELLRHGLDDLEWLAARTPTPPFAEEEEVTLRTARDIPVEQVVERLIEMTPTRLVEVMGPTFVQSVARYVDLFDVPIVRRIPVVRVLIAHRERGPAEVAALAANYLGYSIQAVLALVYYAADLQATISAP
ncbi:MAG: hypothetical protein U1D30_24660, partial [Planctomycetota bacterium]